MLYEVGECVTTNRCGFWAELFDLVDVLELVDAWERGEVFEFDLDKEDADVSCTLQDCMMRRKASKTAGLAGSSGFNVATSFSKRSIRSSGVWPNIAVGLGLVELVGTINKRFGLDGCGLRT